jgi:hypothetical protein
MGTRQHVQSTAKTHTQGMKHALSATSRSRKAVSLQQVKSRSNAHDPDPHLAKGGLRQAKGNVSQAGCQHSYMHMQRPTRPKASMLRDPDSKGERQPARSAYNRSRQAATIGLGWVPATVQLAVGNSSAGRWPEERKAVRCMLSRNMKSMPCQQGNSCEHQRSKETLASWNSRHIPDSKPLHSQPAACP